jgi:hypothetical protein
MPYALLATDGHLFAGLADGQLWESRDRGDGWAPLQLEGGALARCSRSRLPDRGVRATDAARRRRTTD